MTLIFVSRIAVDDGLGDVGLEALLELQFLARVAERRDVGVLALDVLQADVAAGQLAEDDFLQRVDLELVDGAELDRLLFEEDLGLGLAEVEAVGEFLLRLLEGVLHFHQVDFGDDVEGGHAGSDSPNKLRKNGRTNSPNTPVKLFTAARGGDRTWSRGGKRCGPW